jgi:hypothetical protein
MMKTLATRAMRERKNPKEPKWDLRLYVAGQTAKSLLALADLKRICEENLGSRYQIEVVDLMKNPELARGDHPARLDSRDSLRDSRVGVSMGHGTQCPVPGA